MAKDKKQPGPEPTAPQDAGTQLPVPVETTMPLTGQRHLPAAAAAFLAEAKGERQVEHKLPLIQIQHRTGEFLLPSGELAREVSGYPVYYFQTRRYYKKPPKPGEKGSPPDCWSGDMVLPSPSSLEIQHEDCAGCPLNQFGTGRDGRSKACGTYTSIFLLNPRFGEIPLGVIVAPPSSLRTLLGTRFQPGYFGQAAARHGVYEIVWTKFRLRVQGEGESVTYCTLDPVMGPACEDVERVKRIAGVRNQFLALMDEFRSRIPEGYENTTGES